jgi:hypothetical protein
MSSLGEKPPAAAKKSKSAQRTRGDKRDRRSEKKSAPVAASQPLDAVVRMAEEGSHAGALKALQGEKGRRAEKLRSWIRVHQVLHASDEQRQALLQDAERWFRERAGARLPASGGNKSEPVSDRPEDGPLVELLGAPLPRRRDPLVDQVTAFVASEPGRVDEVAAATLARHLALFGAKRVAPWWIGLVGRALATSDGALTRAVIAENEGAYSVTAYGEDGFTRLVEFARAATASGWSIGGMRRGVLGRDEPGERRSWLLRLVDATGSARAVAWLPPSEEAYTSPEHIGALIERFGGSYGVVGVEASGEGNASIRSAAEAAGMCCRAEQDDAAWLEMLAGQSVPDPVSAKQEGNSGKKRDAEASLIAALQAPEVSASALEESIRMVRRRRTVCQIITRTCGVDDDARIAASVDAMVSLWPGDRPLPEVTTLLVCAAAAGGAQCQARLLHGEHAARLGGEGMADVVAVATEVVSQGWSVGQVVRGARRREKENDAGLAALSDSLRGVWRLLVSSADAQEEVWFIGDLPLEGRAGLPLLLLGSERPPILCVGDADLFAWCGENARGPLYLSWPAEDAAQTLRDGLKAWGSVDREEVVQVQDDHADGEEPAQDRDDHHAEE